MILNRWEAIVDWTGCTHPGGLKELNFPDNRQATSMFTTPCPGSPCGPRAVTVSPSTHQPPYQNIWSDMREPSAVTREVLHITKLTHCIPWSMARGLLPMSKARAAWLLDTTVWQQRQLKLCSLTNTAFWERTLQQTNPRLCQLTNC